VAGKAPATGAGSTRVSAKKAAARTSRRSENGARRSGDGRPTTAAAAAGETPQETAKDKATRAAGAARAEARKAGASTRL
jgi:hypothetical protein